MNNLDQEEQGKKVVIGLSGGVSSFIAAYLLKIQKFEIIGVTIRQQASSESQCALSSEELQKIRDFCQRLGIPHEVVESDDYFTEKVQNEWLAQQLELRPWSCFSCHEVRMELLYQKMQELGADYISTGHFAKIFKTEQEVSVHSVHDLSLDQSFLLHKLDRKILAALLLPLASLGAAEIEKLIQNFSLSPRSKKLISCFSGPQSQEFLNKFKSWQVPGDIHTSLGEKLGSFAGPLATKHGQEINFNGSKYYVYSKEPHSPHALAEKESFFQQQEIRLHQVRWSAGEALAGPFYAYLNGPQDCFKVKVYPKGLDSVLVDLGKVLSLKEQEEIVLFKKKGGNSKIILSGIVQFLLEQEEGGEDGLEFVF